MGLNQRSIAVLALGAALAGCRSVPSESPVAQDELARNGDSTALTASISTSTPEPVAPPSNVQGPVISNDIVIARVDDQPLTLQEALDTFISSHTGHGQLVRGEPAVRQLAARIVEQRVFLNEAISLGLPKDPAVLDSVKSFRHNTAAQLFWKREVDEHAKITDDDVEAFYAKTDMALKLAMIATQDRESAEALRARVEQGEDFGELARASSIDSSHTFDGELGFVRRGELDAALEQSAFDLETPGSLSPVVHTAKAWAFVKLEEKVVNPERPPRSVAIPQIRAALESRKKKDLTKQVEDRLLAESAAKIDETRCTRANMLSNDAPDDAVASVGAVSLKQKDLRELLDPDKLAQATESQAADAIRAIARSWAVQQAANQTVDSSGLLDDASVVALTASYERGIVLQKLYDDYVYADLDASDAKLQQYYDEHKSTEFTRPAEVRLAYIEVEKEADATEIAHRAALGEDFAAMAKQYSRNAASAAHGGKVGWVKAGELDPEVEKRAFALHDGELDGPIKANEAWFVVKVLEHHEAVLIPFEVARPAVEKSMLKVQRRDAYDHWAKRLRDRAKVELDADGIRRATEKLEADYAAQKKAEPTVLPAEPEPKHDAAATEIVPKPGSGKGAP